MKAVNYPHYSIGLIVGATLCCNCPKVERTFVLPYSPSTENFNIELFYFFGMIPALSSDILKTIYGHRGWG